MRSLAEGLLKALNNSPKVQQRLAAAHKEQRKKNGGTGAEDYSIARQKLNIALGHVANEIFKKIPSVALLANNSPEGLFTTVYQGLDKDGNYSFAIYFKDKAVHRDSLWTEGYPEGLDNIIALLSHGSKPSKGPIWNTIYGWLDRPKGGVLNRDKKVMYGSSLYGGTFAKGEHKKVGVYREGQHMFIPAGSYIRPNSFLIDAIEAVNKEMSEQNIKLKLDTKYYP